MIFQQKKQKVGNFPLRYYRTLLSFLIKAVICRHCSYGNLVTKPAFYRRGNRLQTATDLMK